MDDDARSRNDAMSIGRTKEYAGSIRCARAGEHARVRGVQVWTLYMMNVTRRPLL